MKCKSDAEDLLFWCRHYASGEDDDPRYEMIGLEAGASLEYFNAGAAVLGRDVARLASIPALERVKELIVHARHEDSPFWAAAVRSTFSEDDMERAVVEGRGLLQAFEWGLSAVRHS